MAVAALPVAGTAAAIESECGRPEGLADRTALPVTRLRVSPDTPTGIL